MNHSKSGMVPFMFLPIRIGTDHADNYYPEENHGVAKIRITY